MTALLSKWPQSLAITIGERVTPLPYQNGHTSGLCIQVPIIPAHHMLPLVHHMLATVHASLTVSVPLHQCTLTTLATTCSNSTLN